MANLNRREFLRTFWGGAAALAIEGRLNSTSGYPAQRYARRPPNVVLVITD
jgi:hypothetical protein